MNGLPFFGWAFPMFFTDASINSALNFETIFLPDLLIRPASKIQRMANAVPRSPSMAFGTCLIEPGRLFYFNLRCLHYE